jgi:hypothetical protein
MGDFGGYVEGYIRLWRQKKKENRGDLRLSRGLSEGLEAK